MACPNPGALLIAGAGAGEVPETKFNDATFEVLGTPMKNFIGVVVTGSAGCLMAGANTFAGWPWPGFILIISSLLGPREYGDFLQFF